MTITNILLAGILVALCVIAYGFRALIKRVDSLAVGARFEGDKNSTPLFAPRETTAAGQTINVNLSPLQASVPGMQSLVVPLAGGAGVTGAQAAAGTQSAAQGAAQSAAQSAAQGATGLQGGAQGAAQTGAGEAEADEPAEAKRAREKERALAAERERAANAHGKNASLVSATQSGLIAIKCPACGAENSAYRNVCFNCGKSL